MADDIKEMTAELASDPDSLVFIRLGEALRVRGQVDAAGKVAVAGLERHPGLADAHDLYARILVDAAQSDNARRVWQTALEIDDRHQGSHKGLGFLYYSRGDLDAALDHLELALAADPTDQGVIQALRVVRAAAQQILDVEEEVAVEEQGEHAFAALEGGRDGLLLVDDAGRVLGGGMLGFQGRDVSDQVAAYLAGMSEEAARTSRVLELGDWQWLSAEAVGGNLHLTRPTASTLLLLVRDTDVPAGRLTILAAKADDVARRWLEEQQL